MVFIPVYRFWYVSLVSCYLDKDCQWVPNEDDFELDYDIWLVNGNPLGGNRNIFRYQYSYDSQVIISSSACQGTAKEQPFTQPFFFRISSAYTLPYF